ncbi:MAG TPA: C4-type zinc ribbon domain-containing protein [Longimicrobiales bacterium]|nr:C4-type zinc ribbon domain-containing protein [Longimicrobiales bacterium]
MQELHAALLALQELDDQIAQAESRVREFTPQFDALEAPVTAVGRELEVARNRLDELRAEQHRLQRNAQQKQERLAVVADRMTRVRNAREESAVKAETDLVRSALDADNADLKDISDQATRTDLKVDELEKQLARAETDIAARRTELEAERAEAETALELLRQQRENAVARIDKPSLRLYERVRSGRSPRALAPLTDEGACGSCFNVLPVQEQSQVRAAEALHRCELCGVILYAT